jgi:hypothetical protein
MKRFMNKKLLVVGLAAGLALGIGGAAFAYFTSSGSGTGTAQVGTATNNIVVTGTETAALVPAGPGGTVHFTVANSATVPEQLSTIHLASISINTSSSAYTSATATQQGLWNACDTTVGTAATLSDPAFSMADVSPSNSDGDIAGGATAQALTATGTLFMNNTGVNQDNCENAPLTLTFTTS